MIPLALWALPACLAVGPQKTAITAADLSPALPGLAGEAAAVSAAPAAGAWRSFGIGELRRIAARFHLAGEPVMPLCFERPVAPPDPALWLAAMRRQLPDGKIEILDYGRTPAPAGDLEFPVAGLRRAGPDGFWNGAVLYGGGRRFALWARVRVSVREARVVAREALRPGPAIVPAQLLLETREVFPGESAFAKTMEAVTGRTARVPVPAGAVVRLDWLMAAPDVLRGDRVLVEVHSGGACLRFEAVAEASGSAGATIPVTNPDSKRRFSARVEGRGRVAVGAGPS